MIIKHLGRLRAHVYSFLRVRTLGASIIAVDDQDRIMLVRNSYSPNQWRLPGGGLKKGESFKEAALREAREEVGIICSDSDPAAISLLSVYAHRIGNWNNHVAVFVMRGWQQEPKKTWEVAEEKRFPVHELPSTVSDGHRRRIEEWQGVRAVADRW